MTRPFALPVRPRSNSERMQLAQLLSRAPLEVGIRFADDGWTAAALTIAGRRPAWQHASSPEGASRVLALLGLPPLLQGTPTAWIDAELTLHGPASPQSAPLPATSGPLITLLVCTFNRASLLRAALASARAQRWPCEVVVVDDGSSDGTAELLASMDGIRAFHQTNQGKPTALELGISQARGEAVLVLDDDDMLLPGAMHVLGKMLFDHPELAVALGDTVVFDDSTGAPMRYAPAMRLPPSMTQASVLAQIPAMPGAALVRRTAQQAAGAYDPSMIRGQDMDMFLRLAGVGPFAAVGLPTFLYRSHAGLRGAAGDQWNKFDQPAHQKRFLSFAQPVFQRRYRAASPISGRAMGHAWALGLHARKLQDEARSEAERWPAPFSKREAWIRQQLALPATIATPTGTLVVVDDGGPGALEATLAQHAATQDLWVNLEVPRDPLGDIRLYWPGHYGARERLHTWVKGKGPWTLRLSSAPMWAPPPLDAPDWLPDLPAQAALLAAGAALDWPVPERSRPGLGRPSHPLLRAALTTRAALGRGDAPASLQEAMPILERWPNWRGGWQLAGEALALAGHPDEAEACLKRARSS
jgi:GT2 family glycosyltransferase